MATNTYVALKQTTVDIATPSVTFTSIPQGYTDLVVVMSAAMSSGSGTFSSWQANGDTGTNYSSTTLYGTGSSTGSERQTNTANPYLNYYSDISTTLGQNTTIATWLNYSNTTTFKTALVRSGTASGSTYPGTSAHVGLWRNTAAITSLAIKANGVNFAAGSTFSLYGIAAVGATPAPKATGGTIYSDSTHYYHVFGASGTFTPTQSITADCLVVAGGGGAGYGSFAGGAGIGGGGGAGGLLAFASQALAATGYTVTVGAGGTASSSVGVTGSLGGDSQFSALTVVKGGGGGGSFSVGARNGTTGGSGGGGATYSGAGTGGGATSGQGNIGGNGFEADPAAGGGGGASAAGANATAAVGGTGGAGSNAYSTWASATGTGAGGFFAGGGGGASRNGTVQADGGSGGGGKGTYNGIGTGTTGLTNTGGGGGGGSNNVPGGSGGSGILIVRYAK
jgi:hypothetical protein